jgi:iron-sulfur cluster repair protein YtfE (RIC family)
MKPIKRAEELISLSRDHHQALLLCWKIKAGLSKNVALSRIYSYVEWFFESHLLPHFRLEEDYVFPLVNSSNRELALEQHQQLKDILQSSIKDEQTLIRFHELLNEHIRFEERILFNEVQDSGGLKRLKGH